MIFEILLGLILTSSTKPNLSDVGMTREISKFAWLPIQTITGKVWLKKYSRVEIYKMLYRMEELRDAQVYGWEFLENRKVK